MPLMGRGAVARNRLKRRLREIARLEVLPRMWAAGASLDVVVRTRGKAYDAAYGRIEAEWVRALEREWSDVV